MEPSGSEPPVPEMKIIFPGGEVTTCVYPGGFLPSRFKKFLFIFFAGIATEPSTNPAATETAILHSILVRTSKEYQRAHEANPHAFSLLKRFYGNRLVPREGGP